MLERIHGPLVVLVDLDAFEYLEVRGAVLALNDERSAAGLALVLDHAADTYRPVELRAQHLDSGFRIDGQRQPDTEFHVQESLYLVAETAA